MRQSQAQCFRLDRAATPIGLALLVTDEDGRLRGLDWEEFEPRLERLLRCHYGDVALAPGPAPAGVRNALDDYFAGALDALARIPWRTGGTSFQRVGAPNAVRAVGGANGANPISIVLPCHRVVGADGTLTGYGGGLHRKRWLLEHERKHANSAVGYQLTAVS